MIQDYLCGITKVRDEEGNKVTVANKIGEDIIWFNSNLNQLQTDKFFDLKICIESAFSFCLLT